MSRNDEYTGHVWENDLKSTVCGIPVEIHVPLLEGDHAIYFCDDCLHVFAGHVKYDPTPAEAALIEAVLGD